MNILLGTFIGGYAQSTAPYKIASEKFFAWGFFQNMKYRIFYAEFNNRN